MCTEIGGVLIPVAAGVNRCSIDNLYRKFCVEMGAVYTDAPVMKCDVTPILQKFCTSLGGIPSGADCDIASVYVDVAGDTMTGDLQGTNIMCNNLNCTGNINAGGTVSADGGFDFDSLRRCQLRSIAFLLLILWTPMVMGGDGSSGGGGVGGGGAGGGCANYNPQNDCNPPCASSCTYYTFSSGSITKTISKIPYNLLQFIPSGEYCDLQGEAGIFAAPVMKKIPYVIGPHTVKKLPSTITLTYQIPLMNSKSGGPCSSGGGGHAGESGGCCDPGEPGCSDGGGGGGGGGK